MLALDEFVKSVRSGVPAAVSLSDGLNRKAAEAIEEDALLGLIEAGVSFTLGVD